MNSFYVNYIALSGVWKNLESEKNNFSGYGEISWDNGIRYEGYFSNISR